MNNDLTFGDWLKRRRAALGVTQEQFAERIGVSPAMLRKLESGERRPSIQVASLLADYFRVAADEREAFVAYARSEGAPSQERVAGGVNANSPWRVARSRQSNLPAPLTRLIGRDVEEAKVREQLLNPRVRLLTLTGPPGIGKTRLALQVAATLTEQFEGGVYFVDLSPIVDPDLVQATIARTLGLKEAATRTLEEVLFGFVTERSMLLVLDNFEQVLDAALGVVKLLQAGSALKMLVTSREALHVRGERRYIVPPLEAPDSVEMGDLERISDYPAVQLFMERTQAIHHDFKLDETNSAAIAELCARLGGLPLSIELITARTRLFSPEALLAHLNKVGDLAFLSGNARDLPDRHRSLRAAIAWSYDLLDSAEQAIFRRLGLFVGSFNAEAAAGLCPGRLIPDVSSALLSLLDKSLLALIEDAPGAEDQATAISSRETSSTVPHLSAMLTPRFAMPETIREYAREQLRGSGEEEIAQRLHARYFMQLAEEAESHLTGSTQAAWLDRLDREYDNFREAFLWAKAARGQRSADDVAGLAGSQSEGLRAAEIALRLAGALGHFWYVRGYYREGQEWLTEALALPASPTPELARLRAKALSMSGPLVIVQGDYATGRAMHEQSLAIRREIGDRKGVGISLNHLGTMAYEQGDFAAARILFEESLTIRREIGDKLGESLVLTNLASTAHQLGDLNTARALLEETLVVKREIGNKERLATTLNNLGGLLSEQGEFEAARAFLEEGLANNREVGSKRGIASSLNYLGDLWYRQGDYEQASLRYRESLAIKRGIHDNISIPAGLVGLGAIAVAIGQVERAARLLGSAANLWEALSMAPETYTRRLYKISVASAQALSGEGAFEQAWSEGRAMSLYEAVEYALNEM